MSSITDLLAAILAAKKGEEVRGSIHDAIEQCYEDGRAGVNDLQARQLIEAVAAVNEEQAAALEVLQARVEELESGEGGSSQQSTTIDIPTVLVDGGVVENVSVNNNSTTTRHITFTTEFTETPKVMVAIGKNVGAVSQYGYLSANILYPTVTTTGFDFFLANRTGSDRSPGVVWYAYQPTVKTIDLDITIPETEGMTEAQVREITGPIAAAVDALKTGYDGTTYQTAAEAVRTQINDLHVLIGDEPGTAIDASAVGYDDSNVADALTGLNGRLDELESGSRGGLSSTQKQTLMNVINALGGAFTTPNAQGLIDAFNSAWNVAVTGISLNKSTLTFTALTSETLRATLSPSDATGTVTWVSSNTSVATVDSNGTVVVVGNGTATITASCGGYSATCAVTVSGIRTTYAVTYNLTGCESSNPQTVAEEDSAFTTNITPATGYLLPFTAYTVTMGGTDITASAWSNGTVSIAEVTGAIVISATATADTRELVANWDFTKSLTDSVGNYEMELINSNSGSSLPTRDATGLHFTAAEQVARCSTITVNRMGYEYELDIASAEFAGDNSKHKRLLLSGGNGIMIFRNAGVLQIYQNAWIPYTAEDGKTIPTSTNDLSGKTVGVKFGSDKNSYLYIDGVLIGTKTGWPIAGQAWTGLTFGGTVSDTQANGNQIHNMTVTGLRVYKEATT